MKVWAGTVAAIALVSLGVLVGLQASPSAVPLPQVTITATNPADPTAFDRGMKAGVEYQTFFCANPQLDGASK